MAISEQTIQELAEYCHYYDIPTEYVVQAMHALKLIPMIRGIAFEFTAYDRLRRILPTDRWTVEKPIINAQAAIQDKDILVRKNSSGRTVSIECKLSGKSSFRLSQDGKTTVRVKCMRSRTANSVSALHQLAQRYHVSVDDVSRHKDQYRKDDFNFVVTTIGNAFWRTRPDKVYEFLPSRREINFLRQFFGLGTADLPDLKKKAFDYFLIAESSKLTVSTENNLTCVREACIDAGTSASCGFIPNYPIVDLQDHTVWKPISEAERVLEAFIRQET